MNDDDAPLPQDYWDDEAVWAVVPLAQSEIEAAVAEFQAAVDAVFRLAGEKEEK